MSVTAGHTIVMILTNVKFDLCADQEVQLSLCVLALTPKKICCCVLRYYPSICIDGLSNALTVSYCVGQIPWYNRQTQDLYRKQVHKLHVCEHQYFFFSLDLVLVHCT